MRSSVQRPEQDLAWLKVNRLMQLAYERLTDRNMTFDLKRHLVPLLLAAVGLALLVPALASAQQPNLRPLQTPQRSYYGDPDLFPLEQILEGMDACEQRARETFPAIADRFADGVPVGTTVLVTMRYQDPFYQFYVELDYIRDGIVYGRMDSADIYLGSEPITRGTTIDVPVSEVIDWTIIYPDRPEEGNLLGKFMMRLLDRLIALPCDPDHPELNSFRVYQPGYSFIPPVGNGWIVSPGNGPIDVSIQRDDVERDMLDTVFSTRSGVRKRVAEYSDDEFAAWLIESEADLLDTDRNRMLEHTVVPYDARSERCYLSNQMIEDSQALRRNTGERVLMLREHLILICFHPGAERMVVTLDYMHRHPPGRRDPDVDERAREVFASLNFSRAGEL
jgi:hypothetical protein